MLKSILLFVTLFGTLYYPSSFSDGESEEILFCTAPNAPGSIIIDTDYQNYLTATALSMGADGYEWVVTSGGFIISGQGTGQIEIGPNCPVPTMINVCVKAYNNGASPGEKCYSSQICKEFEYDGLCFI
ncbi:MAG: hypothetical protein ACNS60_20445 [Candidatus Cyclobacteriaceae bacterium M2_1C_046]